MEIPYAPLGIKKQSISEKTKHEAALMGPWTAGKRDMVALDTGERPPGLAVRLSICWRGMTWVYEWYFILLCGDGFILFFGWMSAVFEQSTV